MNKKTKDVNGLLDYMLRALKELDEKLDKLKEKEEQEKNCRSITNIQG